MDRGQRNHGTCLTSAVGLSCGALGDGGTCPGWGGLSRYLWKLLDAFGMCGVKPLQRRGWILGFQEVLTLPALGRAGP